jgi:hypothetical protein
MKVEGTMHYIKYKINGSATLTNSQYDKDGTSIIISLETKTVSNITIELPRTLIDSRWSL